MGPPSSAKRRAASPPYKTTSKAKETRMRIWAGSIVILALVGFALAADDKNKTPQRDRQEQGGPVALASTVKEGEDKPSGEPTIVLDGWNWKGVHNLPNSLTWGPDGWLYGCHGITVDSLVGAPGTPDAERTRVSCGVWRYHPIKKMFE